MKNQHSNAFQNINNKVASKFNGLIILAVLVSVLLSSAFITAYLIHRYSKDVIEKDRLHNKGLATAVKGFVDHAYSLNYQLSIHTIIKDSITNATPEWNPRVTRYNSGIISAGRTLETSGLPLLTEMQKTYRFADLFFVQDVNGDQVARSFGHLGRRGQRWWFKRMTASRNYRPFFSRSYFSVTGNKPVASAFHPVLKDGKVVGIMGTDINFDKLQDMISGYLNSKDLYAIVIDSEGVIVAHPDREILKELYNLKKLTRQVLARGEDGRPLFDKYGNHLTAQRSLDWDPTVGNVARLALGGKHGYREDITFNGARCTFYYDSIPLPGNNGTYYATILIRNNATLIHSRFTILAFVLFFCAATIALLITLFRFQFHRLVVKPLEDVNEAMKSSDMLSDESISFESADEFQVLVKTYNGMRMRLAAANQELAAINEGLEQRVAQRTLALEKTNKALRRDIERRNKAESDLREAESLYRRTIQASPNSITITRLKDGRYYLVNDSFCRLSGFSREEVIDKTPADLNLFVNPREREKLIDTLKEKGEVNNVEVRYRSRGGTIRDTLFSARALKFKGEECLIAVVADISSRKKAENEVRKLNRELEKRVSERTSQLDVANISLEASIEQAKRLARDAQAASVAKSAFLANMSHEIRTPMNGIIGMCNLAMTTKLDPKQLEYLEIIRSSGNALLSLINDILDFSKIEAGKLSFENISFSFSKVMDDVLDIFQDKISGKDIEMVLDISDDTPARMMSDPLRLRQVMVNLLSNALKFTKKGEIHITVRPKQVSDDKVTLLFCVRDTGIGIAPDIHGKLFDVFSQADGSTTRKYGGTGLGLAICKHIVHMMNGDIWVESDLGQGSRFYFTATFKRAGDETALEFELPENLKDKTALIVEDNATTRLVLTRHLSSFGFKTQTADTAEKAIDIVKQAAANDPLKLVIMDISLPGMDGLTALRKMKSPTSDTKTCFIIISASGGEEEAARIAHMSGAHFLMKPVKQAALYNTIMAAFGHRENREAPQADRAPAANIFTDLKLLLVEDNQINRRVAIEILKSAGVRIDIAENGLQAVNTLREKRYDVVLMDIQMPEMDGLEATQVIRNELGLTSLPIIAITAHTMEGDREQCLRAGMDDYVPKPIDQHQLFSTIQKYLPQTGDFGPLFSSAQVQAPTADKEKFDNLPGLNIQKGLDRIGGTVELYIDIVKEYCDANRRFPDEFISLIEDEDLAAAKMKAHSLKGAAGNISADNLHLAAEALEKACVDGDISKIRPLLDTVTEKLQEVFNSSGLLDSLFVKTKA